MTTNTVTAIRRDHRPRRTRASGTTVQTLALAAAAALLGSALAAAEPVPGASAITSYSGASFSLGLDAALPVAQLAAVAPPLTTTPAAPERTDGRPRLRPVELGDSPALSRLQAQVRLDEGTGRHGGFGRWLKRHWWAPVLVAAAAGVVIADSGGDDDRGGEDD